MAYGFKLLILPLASLFYFVCSTVTAEQIVNLGTFDAVVYEDGSGIIDIQPDTSNIDSDHWSFGVKTDEMTDKIIVTASRRAFNQTMLTRMDSNIYLHIDFSDPKEVLCVGGHDFPGKTAMIRVDKNKPITTNENGCVYITKELDKQLRNGKDVNLRGYHWPYEGADTRSISLSGYSEVSSFLRGKRKDAVVVP